MNILPFLVGTATGIVSGFGVGGGSLLILYLTAVTKLAQHTAGAVNLLYFIGCAPVALIGHAKQKRIEWRTALWCACAGVAVAIPISLLAETLHADLLRRLFGCLLLYVGIHEWKASKRKQNDPHNE